MSIIAIILGASKWPKVDTLVAEPRFERAVDRMFAYMLSLKGLHLNRSDVNWLFDSELDADQLDESLSTWLAEQIPDSVDHGVTDVLVYYVGHGHVAGNEYYLTLRSTRGNNLEQSSLRVSSLAKTLASRCKTQGKYLIIDACFAARAVSAVQLPDPVGFVLIAAAAAYRAGQAPTEFELPAFSRALLESLERGDARLGDRLSPNEVYAMTRAQLRSWGQPDPELYAPGAHGPDLAATGFFPNPATATTLSLDDLARELYSRVVELDRRGRARASALGDRVGRVEEKVGRVRETFEARRKWRPLLGAALGTGVATIFALVLLRVLVPRYMSELLPTGTMPPTPDSTTSTHNVQPLIAIQTDFGPKSPYMGMLVGSIYSLNPNAHVSVITSDIDPFDILQGAWVLWRAARAFPSETIFVAITNPGGTTGRPVVIVTNNGHRYIGFDNGMFDFVVDSFGYKEGFEIASPDLTPVETRDLFGGADLFGPAAAKLALGYPLTKAGPRLPTYVPKLPSFSHRVDGGVAYGTFVDLDGFGNATTNITEEDIQRAGLRTGDELRVEFSASACPMGERTKTGCQLILPLKTTYGQVSKGMPVAILYDQFLQLASNEGSFVSMFKIQRRSPIVVRKN